MPCPFRIARALATVSLFIVAVAGIGCNGAEPRPSAGAVPLGPPSSAVALAPEPSLSLPSSGAQRLVLAQLVFACVGDTRPATENDAAGYPSAVIETLYSDIEALSPRPSLVVSTGDYMYASQGNAAQAAAQLDLYMQARARYSGVLLPAMGNHECTGETSANCGPDALGGLTTNYVAFVDRLLAPIGETDPYYVVRVGSVTGTWTAKFVILAANAWSSVQQRWLATTLAEPTTYTFIVRHEPAAESEAPGVTPSEQIMESYPYTLALVGHAHSYGRYPERPREVIIGNGGAPLSSKDYGFALFSQQADGAIAVDMVNFRTSQSDGAFHFVVRPDGTVL